MEQLATVANVLVGATTEVDPAGPAVVLRLSDFAGDQLRPEWGVKAWIRRGEASQLRPADVVLRARGESYPARVAGAELEGAFANSDFLVVRPASDRLDSHYLAAFLNLPATQGRLGAQLHGSIAPRLTREALAALELPLPSLTEQRGIAGLAQAMEAEQGLLHRLSALTQQRHQALLRDIMEKARGNGRPASLPSSKETRR
jgi:hypothetical protein